MNVTGVLFASDENIYGRAAFALMDVERGANLFAAIAGPFASAGKSLAGKGKFPCLKCFVAGTEIQTERGLIPIEEIKIDDKVLSYNEATGETEYQPVVSLFTRYADDVWELKVEGEEKPIEVTSEHPFYVKVHGARSNTSGEGEWREASKLKIGDEIRTASGNWAKVESIKPKENAVVYNFEVANNHNYFVGQSGLLTHNAKWCGSYDEVNKGKPYAEKIFDKLTGGNWQQRGTGGNDVRVGTTRGGRPANFHESTTQPGRPTIEVGKHSDLNGRKRRY